MDPYTVNFLLNNRIKVRQFAQGYRFSMDPLILAAHIYPYPYFSILDVGCGCGIISLILACQYESIQVCGVEIQEPLACLSLTNAKINNFENRFRVLNKNIGEVLYKDLGSKVDLVVSNPPYTKKGAGRIGPNRQNSIARHEITMDVKLLCTKASELTKEEGCLSLIFPAERLNHLETAMQEAGLFVDRLRFVYTGKGGSPGLVMASGRKKMNGSKKILPPLHIFDENGSHSEEYNEIIFKGHARYPIIGSVQE